MVDFSNVGTVIILSAGMIVVAAIVIAVMYFENKSSQGRERRADPLQKAIITTGFVAVLVILAELFGAWEQGSLQEKWWWLFVIFGAALVLYMITGRVRVQIPFRTLYNKYALPTAKEIWHGEPYRGPAEFKGLMDYKVVILGNNEETQGTVGIFLIQLANRAGQIYLVLIGLNVFTAAVVQLDLRPDVSTTYKIFGRESVGRQEDWRHQFEQEETNLRPTGQPTRAAA